MSRSRTSSIIGFASGNQRTSRRERWRRSPHLHGAGDEERKAETERCRRDTAGEGAERHGAEDAGAEGPADASTEVVETRRWRIVIVATLAMATANASTASAVVATTREDVTPAAR